MRALRSLRFLFILACCITSGSTVAQDIDTIKTWTVEQFAQRMTDQMSTRAALKPEQVELVQKINLTFAGQVLSVVNGSGDQQSNLEAVKKFDRQRTAELEVFLSAEQMRQVRQVQNENRKQMKKRYQEKHL